MRDITPAKLYADVWINPSVKNLIKLYNHFRTLDRILYNYLPRHVVASIPEPGVNKHRWEQGTLMFTDLAGFTPLLEKNSQQGEKGAKALHKVLNQYFGKMIQIISKSGGNLLEFTGDAMLVQFPSDAKDQDINRAIRAGLRMQREMTSFSKINILGEEFSIGMRIGIHNGNFLTADIGTPHRMEHILLGNAVLRTKKAESNGENGRVCLSPSTLSMIQDEFRTETTDEGHGLIIDDLSEEELGDYDIVVPKSRMASMVLFDHSREGLVQAITEAIEKLEPLAGFIPRPILNLLVENASSRGLPPDFPEPTLLFINLLGLPENLHEIDDENLQELVTVFSRLISVINAEIETHGGVMKKVTYHHAGPDIMAFFGAPIAHTNDVERAVKAAQGIRSLVKRMDAIDINGETYKIQSHIGLNQGQAFAAEIGDRQGRREFNVLGNTVNTAARLMDFAEANQIILSESVSQCLSDQYPKTELPNVILKGRSVRLTLWELE
jgi:class 3 adenylate cyclase